MRGRVEAGEITGRRAHQAAGVEQVRPGADKRGVYDGATARDPPVFQQEPLVDNEVPSSDLAEPRASDTHRLSLAVGGEDRAIAPCLGHGPLDASVCRLFRLARESVSPQGVCIGVL